MNNQKKMGNKGFSLVELIVVIAIMAVLVGVLAPQFLRYVEKSRQSGDMSSVQALMNAVETGVSDDEISGDEVEIAIDGTGCTVSGDLGNAFTDSGLSTNVALKSSGWGSITLSYDTANFTWTISGSTVNEKKPGLDMADVLNKSASN